jgi:lipid II:glycine glycyltransferase (peptidoglycan interpeptide bridge formation enzyme)
MSIPEKEEWAKRVVSQLKEFTNIKNDKFIFLTDRYYSEFICKYLKNVELPLAALEHGNHLEWLNNKIEKKAGNDL